MDALDSGTPGGSFQREYERRLAAHEQRVVERRARITAAHPWIGRWLIGRTEVPHTTTAFAKRAAAERAVAERFDRDLGDSVRFLYNRRLGIGPERRGIDIIAIAPGGVFVIDPKAYAGKQIRANRAGDEFVVDGRLRPALSLGMRRHIDAVAIAVSEGPIPAAEVSAAYCFIEADLPWGRMLVDNVLATTPRGVVKMLKRAGPLTAEDRSTLHQYLGAEFPPA
ncbi:nuclease-related domain-containing protein [Aeromicrobium sp.]|uniref:nuclease-related domain-containing protein n=1 Tax=Aeromicrobium sp. TaxID=1871063 RepID=UPI002FCC7A01